MDGMEKRAEALAGAREKLAAVTPLTRDCGALCGARCCAPDEDGRGGMLLFPGEETYYKTLPRGFAITRAAEGPLLTCGGTCAREERPLACRVFPLMFALEGGVPGVRPDPRAWPLCPLMPSGMPGLLAGFVQAAREAAQLLCASPEHRAFIEAEQLQVAEMTRPLWEGSPA